MKKLTIAIIYALLLYGCTDEIPMVNLGIDDVYYIARMQKLDLHPALTGEKYEWYVDGELVSKSIDYIFLESKEGTYNLELKILDPNTPYDFSFTVHVLHEEIEYSAYISKVYEYCPAPGQFINEMPRYEEGDTYETILQKAEESISGTNDIMISLGGYGGYVTFGFDHTVINIPGEKDFRIWGNAFYELLNPDQRGGSAEPGIVMVSYDTNCNGLPDDEWYELAGSEYYKAETRHNYTITYRRPDPDRILEEDDSGFLDDINYIPWSDSDGASGHMAKNTFHNQSYYPLWIKADNISFTGTRLAPNGIDLSGTGRYYVLYAYDWGYVDNHPNEYDELNSFDISWAVDSEGNKVHLPGVDFVRVYTGLNQYCGWLGETSTELSRAQDLHIALPGIPLPDPLE
ncbi:PKD-like domain-containing protein [Muribaculum intestinale]|uniref:PKD-like domain-containing protein n=1 Tax=Muribaculum intestinale TaxID=1796646 RepID=UPI00242B2222|nr:PKD-like domain-containing protein [Muribaculum intestinale]